MVSFLRFISPLLHPLGAAWLALVIGCAICIGRRRPLGAVVLALGALGVWLPSQPPLANGLMLRLEQPWASHTLADAPSADAIVVLGGGWRKSRHDFVGLDLTPAADRWVAGLELYRLGRATNLVVGGDDPIIGPTPTPRPDSQGLRQWLDLWGFSEVRLETLGPVATTREEALKTREIVTQNGWREILLVTSAFHMRRSIATFEKLGMTVHPVACDFQAAEAARWEIFPDFEAFLVFWLWWHEELSWRAHRLLDHL